MELIRTFIAIELPAQIHIRLGELITNLSQARLPVRWVNQDNIHLTLKFLGEISASQLEVSSRILALEAPHSNCFSCKVEGMGVFPNPRKPRIIWAGIPAPPELIRLQQRIDNALSAEGYSKEERPFSPHLTLGRVQQYATETELRRIGELVTAKKNDEIGTIWVDALCVFQSRLQREGPVYTRLNKFALAEKK